MSKYIYREVKNGLIIDGVLHELAETKRNDCLKCSLRNKCDNGDYLICDMFGAGKYEYFVSRGKVTVALSREEPKSVGEIYRNGVKIEKEEL